MSTLDPALPAPSDPDFAQRTRDSFARQGLMATLGAQLISVAPGAVSIGLDHRESLSQQHGFLHAGALAAALDSAAGYAAGTLMPADAGVLTIEFKVNLLAAAVGPRFRCDAVVVKAGRTITVAEAEAWQFGDDGRPARRIATLTATLMTVRGRDGVQA
jgi:uncharacterized protein (TIGR00369 family)